MIEIERKFLVLSTNFLRESFNYGRIVQGYLSSHPERSVRVRVKENKGFITVKGKSSSNGTTRLEWEKEISIEEAKLLLSICESGIIDKVRHDIYIGKHHYEVDVFKGDNEGLILAEIELQSEDEVFEKPFWLGQEVTNDERFYNVYLSQHPYTTWK